MALTTTTLSAAVAVKDNKINLTSLTGLVVGDYIRVDDEYMRVTKGYASANPVPVQRGCLGSVGAAHVSGANATHGTPDEFGDAPAQAAQSYQKVERTVSYSASGAITLPKVGEDLVVLLNGTDALAMTVADPDEALDGCRMTILGGAAAHTITFASGLSGASTSYDVFTFNGNAAAGMEVVAFHGYWVSPSMAAMGGTLTNIIGSLA